jgi:hypothetical protein
MPDATIKTNLTGFRCKGQVSRRFHTTSTVKSHSDFSEAVTQECKTGAAAPVLVCSVIVYQADNFCFLRRATNPSSPKPANIMA